MGFSTWTDVMKVYSIMPSTNKVARGKFSVCFKKIRAMWHQMKCSRSFKQVLFTNRVIPLQNSLPARDLPQWVMKVLRSNCINGRKAVQGLLKMLNLQRRTSVTYPNTFSHCSGRDSIPALFHIPFPLPLLLSNTPALEYPNFWLKPVQPLYSS